MRTTFDVDTIIYLVLKGTPAIISAISGDVYKNVRPLNSNKVDIVVGSLPINGEQIQRAVLNVNIHVPNLRLTIGGVQDNTQPDSVRLSSLTQLVIETLDNKVFSDYWFDVQQQVLFKDEADHYSNIRINFYSENI